jgi:hypothetical protein
MGGVSSVFSTLGTIGKGVSLVANAFGNDSSSRSAQRGQELALRQLQDQQRLNAQNLAQQTALERDKLTAQSQIAEKERQLALRRAVARQRANFGSQGVSTGSGSSQAVLLGLFDESADELAARERLDGLKNRALDLDISQNQSLGLLQRTQLQERQKLDKISYTQDRIRNGLNFGVDVFDRVKPRVRIDN